jgi:16S rRNA (guanine966-N2)-methyltransferase
MRIIAGEWRGRVLRTPVGATTRPTSDRTREALFSMLASRLGSFEELQVADLFAGTGALGFEALSRGAARCVFVEQDRGALAALESNAATLKAGPRADIRRQSALAAIPGPFDLVMLDPPYDSGLGISALAALLERDGIAPGAWISLETGVREAVELPGLAIEAERVHGKAKLTLMRRTKG